MIRSFLAVCAVACLPLVAHADTMTISDGGASYVLRTDDFGQFSSNLDVNLGGFDLGYADQWFLAVDGDFERSLRNGTVSTSPSGSESFVLFSIRDVEVEIFYSISEQVPGRRAQVDFSAKVTNRRNESISGTLGNYVDYDLGPSVSDDSGFVRVRPNRVVMGARDGELLATRRYNDADRFETGEFATGIYGETRTAELDNTNNGFSQGDWVGAAQWDFQLDSGEFVTFNGRSIYAVPEPAGALVLLVGLAGIAIGRRRR